MEEPRRSALSLHAVEILSIPAAASLRRIPSTPLDERDSRVPGVLLVSAASEQ
jgi:hypothetical protein